MKKSHENTEQAKGIILLLLLLTLSFLAPYAAGFLAEQAIIKSWENYGFSPDRAKAWRQSGVWSRRTALSWRTKNFTPGEAVSWRTMKIPPDEAAEWRDGGFAIADAMEWRRYAFPPYKAAEWKRMDFSLGEATAWRKHAFEPEEAGKWRDRGLSPMAAAEEKGKGGDLDSNESETAAVDG